MEYKPNELHQLFVSNMDEFSKLFDNDLRIMTYFLKGYKSTDIYYRLKKGLYLPLVKIGFFEALQSAISYKTGAENVKEYSDLPETLDANFITSLIIFNKPAFEGFCIYDSICNDLIKNLGIANTSNNKALIYSFLNKKKQPKNIHYDIWFRYCTAIAEVLNKKRSKKFSV